MQLKDDIKFVKGVGEKRADMLKLELGVITVEDMLYTFPYRYIDRASFHQINSLSIDMPYVQLKAKIMGFRVSGMGAKMRLTAVLSDGTGTLEALWFKGLKWIQQNHKVGETYVFFGKPTNFKGTINLVHPEVESIQNEGATAGSKLEPLYNTSEKMKKGFLHSKAILKLQKTILDQLYGKTPETLPVSILDALKLMALSDALLQVHFPENDNLLQKARYRLKFEELFYIQMKLLREKLIRTNQSVGFVFTTVGDYFNTFFNKRLPFELTGAQKRVIKEIRKDTLSGKQMNRLLQGDVGSGKTMVALMSCLLALDNDFQACIMAPTEILAQQHLISVKELLGEMNISVALLTGSTKAKARRQIHADLLSGELKLLIGTHAIIEDIVQFRNLGLAVIDEQHRFGVAQRAKLWAKNTTPPHVVVMTATPIPRTLSMTLYGDLEISVIDELPPGRKPIKTLHAFDSKRLRVFKFIKDEIEKGRQIYIVYPLIKESETLDYKDLHDGYESISRAFPPPNYAVSVVHGQMKPNEKELSMQYFVKGQTHIMVATTVIEVGVNVPNASVMIIESAERFGLSQLHQLRGRVGRGGDQSYCILMTGYKLSKEARTRIDTMVNSNDGFVIAETDLKLRGPGDMQGTQQSGTPINLKIADLAHDGQILSAARNIASDILKADPGLIAPENTVVLQQVNKRFSQLVNWGKIS